MNGYASPSKGGKSVSAGVSAGNVVKLAVCACGGVIFGFAAEKGRGNCPFS
jgi:hypothetical protein